MTWRLRMHGRGLLRCAAVLSGVLCFGAGAWADDAGVWRFVDGDGVLHLGNSRAASLAAEDLAPADVAAPERRVTWINHTWTLRYPVEVPPSVPMGVARTPPVAATAPGPSALRLPKGLEAVWPHLEAAARQFAVEPALVVAVAAAESAFNTEAISNKGALGLMQIMPATAERYGVAVRATPDGWRRALEPSVNASVGSRYLADLLRMFGGDKTLAVAAYNAGEGAVAKYGNRIPPYPETQQYVQKVMRLYQGLVP